VFRVAVLVTGGAGFIGSNLVGRLAADGVTVSVIDDFSTGRRGNLDHLGGTIDVRTGDIRDEGAVRRAVAEMEVVYHLAALPSVARSISDPARTHAVNVDGTLNVLNAARAEGVRRVVYASSSSVYGDTPTLPKHEDMAQAPRSPYAASKLAGESYCRAYAHSLDVATVSLRFFNVFGPRQDPASEYAAVIPRFITRMLDGDQPVIFGDGKQTRDFTFVDNVVRACILASGAGPRAVGEVVNIGCGDRISLLDLVDALNAELGIELTPEFAPPRTGDVRDSQASVTKASELIGYRPTVSLNDGLRATIDWFRDARAV
jgi:UDP-glucose 4-epimerase